jgi:hypothetical protein
MTQRVTATTEALELIERLKEEARAARPLSVEGLEEVHFVTRSPAARTLAESSN